jgi:hypothetical protein
VYGREINGEEHTFGVSGKLIMNALVMYDHQTMTLWSQFLRKGIKGPLAETELEILPSTQTTWALWRDLHPDTKVLNKRGSYQSDSYDGYYMDGSAGVIGETFKDDRLPRKELVLGVNIQGSAKAYPFSALENQPVVNDSVASKDVLVFFDTSTGTSLVYDRTVEGNSLTFRIDEGSGPGLLTLLVDNETGSKWRAFTGKAVEGDFKGKTLERQPSHLSFWFAWTDWNPETELYSG